jgi:hypothetical protein
VAKNKKEGAMDTRIERAQVKINMVRWALAGMVMGDLEPKKADLENLLVMVSEINRDLDQAIEEEASDGVGEQPTESRHHGMA